MKDLKGKTILLFGGFYQHCKVVEACHELGIRVIVTDYLPLDKAPAKKIADKYYFFNIDQIDEIIAMCKNEKVDGVLCTHSEACVKAYQQVCEILNYPCFGTKEQYDLFTNKEKFKQFCRKNHLDTIPEYSVDDVIKDRVDYPLFIKPTSSNGSKGQTICNTKSEALDAIRFALECGRNNKVTIEKYFQNGHDFSVDYLFIDGKAILVRTNDRYVCDRKSGLNNSSAFNVSPSKYSDYYLNHTNERMIKALQQIGFKNGPCFFQGFIEKDKTYFYDPALRFPGEEYDRQFKSATGINIVYPLVEFALTGHISDEFVMPRDIYMLNNHIVASLYIPLKPGVIGRIEGLDIVQKFNHVIWFFINYSVGDCILQNADSRRRLCEIVIDCNTIAEMKALVKKIYKTVYVLDNYGHDMIAYRVEPSCLNLN